MKNKSVMHELARTARKIKGEITEDAIYSSPEMMKYLKALSDTTLKGKADPVQIILTKDDEDGTTAKTNGEKVIINWNSTICRRFMTLEDRFTAFMGMFYHEHAHILYNDFEFCKKVLSRIESGSMYGKVPVANTDTEQAVINECIASIKDPAYTRLWVYMYGNVENMINDEHDERRMGAEYGKSVKAAIAKAKESLRKNSIPIEKLGEEVAQGKYTKLSAVYQLILEYIRFERFLYEKEDVLSKSEYGDVMKKVASHLDKAKRVDNPSAKFDEINYIAVAIWPYIKEEVQKLQNPQPKENGASSSSEQTSTAQNEQTKQTEQTEQKSDNVQGNSDSGLPSPTEEQIQQLLNELEAGASAAGLQPVSEASIEEMRQIKSSAEAKKGRLAPKDVREIRECTGDEEEQETPLDSILEKIAQTQAEKDLEKSIAAAIESDANMDLGETSSHKNIPLHMIRPLEVSAYDISDYEYHLDGVKVYTQRLIKKLKNILKEDRGAVKKHRSYGKLLCEKDFYRPDKKYFGNKKEVSDDIDLALCVLVDHSGSMKGNRLLAAKKAAIMLYEFADGLDIPISICGHRTNGRSVEYVVYTDYDNISHKDKYRLAQMYANGCNRDGAAIEIACSRLARRPEKNKLCIIISDGRPNHYGYKHLAAENDVTEIVNKYRKKGIEILAASIGDDEKTIRRIYGDGCMSISDLSLLPDKMVSLLKKRILKNIA